MVFKVLFEYQLHQLHLKSWFYGLDDDNLSEVEVIIYNNFNMHFYKDFVYATFNDPQRY